MYVSITGDLGMTLFHIHFYRWKTISLQYSASVEDSALVQASITKLGTLLTQSGKTGQPIQKDHWSHDDPLMHVQ